MRDPRDLMIEKQAERIDLLNQTLRELPREQQKRIEELEQKVADMKGPAFFYKELQDAILENPILQSEWDRFVTMLKMAKPEMDREYFFFKY